MHSSKVHSSQDKSWGNILVEPLLLVPGLLAGLLIHPYDQESHWVHQQHSDGGRGRHDLVVLKCVVCLTPPTPMGGCRLKFLRTTCRTAASQPNGPVRQSKEHLICGCAP